MATVAILGLLGCSSVVLLGAAYAVRPWRAGDLRHAVAAAALFAGLWAICLGIDVAFGVAVVLAVRTLTARFVSAYIVSDVVLVGCAAMQAAILHALLRRSHASPAAGDV
jgi:hypothetical protein